MAKIRIKRVKPIVNYVGSLIQNNHGENVKGHGFNIWDVKSRSFTFHELPNDYGYYTIRVNGTDVPDTSDMPKNVRLRIFSGDLDEASLKQYIAMLKTKHNIIECSITRPSMSRAGHRVVDTSSVLDVNDLTFQNKLLQEYIADTRPDASEALVDKVLEIHAEIHADVATEDASTKITWVPLSLRFDNLFTYGPNNYIDFTSLAGTIGIFAPNASGKSSIPDAISFALFDRTPRTTRAANIMNTRKSDCFCEFVFSIGDDVYTVQRTGKRNKKGEVKIDVDFWVVDKNGVKTMLNGEERRVTNDHIRQYVGDFDDFILTAFSVQDKNSLFIDRGQSDRKDVLSQFMGLQILDKLHEEAKERSRDILAELKQFKNDDFTDELVADAINSLHAGNYGSDIVTIRAIEDRQRVYEKYGYSFEKLKQLSYPYFGFKIQFEMTINNLIDCVAAGGFDPSFSPSC